MKIGNYQVHRIDAGRFRLDGGAMFGVVPKTLWQKQKPADPQNRIKMSTNLLLIRDRERNILIDTGLGNKFPDKLVQIYAIDHSEFSLESGLKQHNLRPQDITDVIFTHLHFDHAGGATYRDKQGILQPTFNNARHYVQKEHLRWALKPTERDAASFFPENYAPLQEHGLLQEVDGEAEVFPGIKLLPIHGHTPFQQMVMVEDHRQTLLFAGDLVPTSAHVPLPWVMGYDLQPLTTLEEKRRYLIRAAEEKHLVVFEHDPEIHCGWLKMTDRGPALGDIGSLDPQ